MIEYFIVELFIDDPRYLSLCYAHYILLKYALNPNSMIEIAPEL